MHNAPTTDAANMVKLNICAIGCKILRHYILSNSSFPEGLKCNLKILVALSLSSRKYHCAFHTLTDEFALLYLRDGQKCEASQSIHHQMTSFSSLGHARIWAFKPDPKGFFCPFAEKNRSSVLQDRSLNGNISQDHHRMLLAAFES